MAVAIDEFRHTYIRLCNEQDVEPQECILNQLTKAQQQSTQKSGYCLDLSANGLNVNTCVILGQVLSTDHAFTEILFNDCMITEDGMRAILQGLATNVTCRKLDLKGNNIRGTATETLGRTLRQNAYIQSLGLEWNAMGLMDVAFGIFCEGLGANVGLQVLDLRSNQINHSETTNLANALKTNTNLKALDLRWNNIGLIGGRAILGALDYNKTLIRLELLGNNIPNDILKAIDTAISHNAERMKLTSDYMTRAQLLSKEMKHLEQLKNKELSVLMDQVDQHKSALNETDRNSKRQIHQLHQTLGDRQQQLNVLSAKVCLMESEKTLAESRVSELSMMLEKCKEQMALEAQTHQRELKREKEDRLVSEAKLNKELMELNQRFLDTDTKASEFERSCQQKQEQIFELKQQLAHQQADNKMKVSQLEEKLTLERQKAKDAFKDAEEMRQREVDLVRRECADNERMLKDRIQRQEQQRLEMEEQIGHLRSMHAMERVQADEQMLSLKQKLKAEEEMRLRQLEEKNRILQASKDELQTHSIQQNNTIADLQSKMSQLVLENEAHKRSLDTLRQELAGKNNEMLAEVTRVRHENDLKIRRLETEMRNQSEVNEQIVKLEKLLAETNNKHRVTLDEKDRQIDNLEEKLRQKEAEIRHLMQEEAERAQSLHVALQAFTSKAISVKR